MCTSIPSGTDVKPQASHLTFKKYIEIITIHNILDIMEINKKFSFLQLSLTLSYFHIVQRKIGHSIKKKINFHNVKVII